MNAEIVTTGTKLLLGEVVDTNAAYIARQLREVGVNLFYKTTVGDNRARLAEVLQDGLRRSDVLIVTGGLGPTVDDITREAVADAVGRPLELRPELVDHLQQMFARWGRDLTGNNLRQAYLPEGAEVIPNPIGTAVGFSIETDAGRIICMPGVPREMKRMMSDYVLPSLQERMGVAAGVIRTRILHVAGVGESAIDDRIADLMVGGNPTVGLAAHLGRVDIRIAARGASAEEAEALIAPVETDLRARLWRWIYGADDETLGSVVAHLLRTRGADLATLETNTGGRVASFFGEGDRDVLKVTESFDGIAALPAHLTGGETVDPGRETALRAAHQLRKASGAACVLALLGTNSAEQGFWSANRGETWVALLTPGAEHAERFTVGGSDEFSAQWLAIYALNFLRQHLV